MAILDFKVIIEKGEDPVLFDLRGNATLDRKLRQKKSL